tara:strand:+ start:144 stop:353 length:210 start_codon:yes stop_codon:yes gene_type:complete
MRNIPQIELDNCIEMFGSKKDAILFIENKITMNTVDIENMGLEMKELLSRYESRKSNNKNLHNIINHLK